MHLYITLSIVRQWTEYEIGTETQPISKMLINAKILIYNHAAVW